MGRGRIVSMGVVVALLGASACSSSGHSAVTGLRSARVRIATWDDGDKSVDFAQTGAFDYTHDVGEYEMVAGPGTKSVSREDAVIHDGVFVTQLTRDSARTLPAAVKKGRHWIEDSSTGAQGAPIGPNPYTELARLRAQGAKLVDHGTTRVDGQTVHHESTTLARTDSFVTPHQVEHYAYDVYVDPRGRVVRLVTNNVSAHIRDQADFSDFGAPVHVTVPRSSDIVRYSTAITPTPKLQGAWAQVASGRNARFSWKLFRAPADIDRVCWSFEADPPLPAAPNAAAPGIVNFSGPVQSDAQVRATLGSKGPWPRHDGHDATCTRTGSWQTDLQGIATSGSVLVAVLGTDIVGVTGASGLQLLASHSIHVSPERRVGIDPRFHGFVDLEAPGQVGGLLLSNDSYTLEHRDGRHTSCNTTFLSSPVFGADACARPGGLLPSTGTVAATPPSP